MSAANTGSDGGSASAGSKLVTTMINLVPIYIQLGRLNDPSVYSDSCISLASGIDFAVVNTEVPAKSRDLPLLLRQIYIAKNDLRLQADFMVLMISIKSACKVGWFSNEQTDDLLNLANEVGKQFFDNQGTRIEPQCLPYISNIISRFYPTLKMERVLAALETNRELGAFAADFHISRGMVAIDREKIWLFVARKDNMDTCSCIISPPEANFLLNGKEIHARVNVTMDKGHRLPTDVTPMLNYGPNLLQVVGKFNGHYMVVVAIMSTILFSDSHHLQDYVPPTVASEDSDVEIIEMTSRISLNCPVSRCRIKTPVKGHLCNHAQVNSWRAYWWCPCCKQPVCHQNIRIDQNMVKVLKEAGENVVNVIISANGSWTAVMEIEEKSAQRSGTTKITQLESTDSESSSTFSADSLDSFTERRGFLGALVPVTASPAMFRKTPFSMEPNSGRGIFSHSHSSASSGTSLVAQSTNTYSSSSRPQTVPHKNLVNSNEAQSSTQPRNTPFPSLHFQPVQLHGRTVNEAEGTTHQAALSSDNWRPCGRMRGSLKGEAYTAALRQFMSQPAQPARASVSPPPGFLPPHLPGNSGSSSDQSR